ncbi:MAG TPA: alpha/beta hydrolase family protein [Mycobacterium sp.]|uniref:alpha/beta hydrolase family protein n=1 Tax=Mycobacterium sp. TaxID=1785 RepID=UPI002D397104|nr:alpha/beta hydrolase family protein [Mycobacterium sp.]HZU48265.1 alpha/beta hydrolase family protein [Mycobacterium sp.]
MTLSVADIDRWNAEAVREVFHVATARGQATLEVSRQLGTLAVFDTWEGQTAEARKHQNTQIRKDLDAHGNEALAVGRAANQAADGIENVQAKLRQLRADAAALHMTIDPMTNAVVPSSTFKGLPIEALIAEEQLQHRLDEILAEANAVDSELAAAINMADGDTPIPADAGPPIGPQGLTPTQRESDANQARLRDERAKLQHHIDELQGRYDRLAAHGGDSAELQGLKDQLNAAHNRMAEFDSVDRALTEAPETYLTQLQIPTDPKQKVGAAVAVGNPDTASNISVTVPGVGSTTKASLPGMVNEANNLRREEIRQLTAAGKPASVAAIAWMNYNPPNPLDSGSPQDLLKTMTDAQAKAGAGDLSKYLEHVRANNPTGHLTVLGHSYGSLTASLALQQLNAEGVHPVNDVVFYGSPGLELYSPARLGLDHGSAYVMQAPHDLITNLVAPLAPVHGWGLDPYAPGSGMIELSSQSGFDPGGIWRDGVYGHADYPRTFQDALGHQELRMSGYNLAAIAAGLPGNKVTASLLPPILGGGMPGGPRGH